MLHSYVSFEFYKLHFLQSLESGEDIALRLAGISSFLMEVLCESASAFNKVSRSSIRALT